jgi:protease-4
MQSIADEAYEQFTGIIAASRGLTIAQTKKLADGRIFTANQALKNKLIDATDSFENTIDKFTEELSENLSKKVKVKHIENKSKNNIADFFMEKIQNIIPKNELENVVNMFALPDNLDFPAYYYAK